MGKTLGRSQRQCSTVVLSRSQSFPQFPKRRPCRGEINSSKRLGGHGWGRIVMGGGSRNRNLIVMFCLCSKSTWFQSFPTSFDLYHFFSVLRMCFVTLIDSSILILYINYICSSISLLPFAVSGGSKALLFVLYLPELIYACKCSRYLCNAKWWVGVRPPHQSDTEATNFQPEDKTSGTRPAFGDQPDKAVSLGLTRKKVWQQMVDAASFDHQTFRIEALHNQFDWFSCTVIQRYTKRIDMRYLAAEEAILNAEWALQYLGNQAEAMIRMENEGDSMWNKTSIHCPFLPWRWSCSLGAQDWSD